MNTPHLATHLRNLAGNASALASLIDPAGAAPGTLVPAEPAQFGPSQIARLRAGLIADFARVDAELAAGSEAA